MWAAIAILGALRERDRTGRGVNVTTALYETALAWGVFQMNQFLGTGEVPLPQGSGTAMICPYEAFPTRDAWVMIAAGVLVAAATAGVGRTRLRRALVAAQVAVSVVLLITAGLFVGSLSKALRVDPGFEVRQVRAPVGHGLLEEDVQRLQPEELIGRYAASQVGFEHLPLGFPLLSGWLSPFPAANPARLDDMDPGPGESLGEPRPEARIRALALQGFGLPAAQRLQFARLIEAGRNLDTGG